MATMQAVRIYEFGGPEVLRLENIERPEPGPSEVLIEIQATSVNPVDYKIRSGSYPGVQRHHLPKTLGRDVSGIVVKCGKGVTDFRPGDAIYALLDRDHGSYAEYVALRSELCARKPEAIDHATAAAVPLAALTAWQGLFDHGGLQSGQTVLIHGGAGGVGHFAIQFAHVKGARVATTVRKDDVEFARALGADIVIDTESQRFEAEVRDVDLVFDLIGGETQQRSWSVLKRDDDSPSGASRRSAGGVMVSTLGQPSQDEARRHGVRAVGYLAEPNVAELAEIGALIDHGEVRPVVQARFLLPEIGAAQEHIEKHHTIGKVVIDVVLPIAAE